jgi:hypothetical protein
MNGRKGWKRGEPCSCTRGVGEEVKCARMAGVEALEVKAEMRERIEERRAARGVGILFPFLMKVILINVVLSLVRTMKFYPKG